MNENNILNILHKAFPKVKTASLVIFIFAISLVTLRSNYVYGEGNTPVSLTKISVKYDDQSKSYQTTGKNVLEALNEGGINLADKDITNPPLDTKLTGDTLSVVVTRALPVLISDNNQQQLAFSAYSEPKDILKQLEIEVFPEDIIQSNLILDPVDEGTVGQKISISRAPVFSVEVDGEIKLIRSWGKTVSSVITGKIALGKNDIVEPSVDAESPLDGKISITRVNIAEIEETETIPYSTTYKDDYSLFKGQTKVAQEGTNGSKKVKYQITYYNGEEVGRTVLSSESLSQVQTKIVIRGLKPYNAGAWWDTLVQASNKYPNNSNITPDKMFSVMTCESGGNPFAGTYYKGLFQYAPDTWSGASAAAGYRGAAITDGEAQIFVTAWKVNNDGGWRAWGCKP